MAAFGMSVCQLLLLPLVLLISKLLEAAVVDVSEENGNGLAGLQPPSEALSAEKITSTRDAGPAMDETEPQALQRRFLSWGGFDLSKLVNTATPTGNEGTKPGPVIKANGRGAISFWAGKRLDINFGDLVVRAINPTTEVHVNLMADRVSVEGKEVCDDVSKLSKEATYQKTKDGTFWHANIKVGDPMTQAEIATFERDWGAGSKGGDRKAQKEGEGGRLTDRQPRAKPVQDGARRRVRAAGPRRSGGRPDSRRGRGSGDQVEARRKSREVEAQRKKVEEEEKKTEKVEQKVPAVRRKTTWEEQQREKNKGVEKLFNEKYPELAHLVDFGRINFGK